MIGEYSREHGPVEAGGHDHEGDDGAAVAAGQADANQARGGDEGGDGHAQLARPSGGDPAAVAGEVQGGAVSDGEQPVAQEGNAG